MSVNPHDSRAFLLQSRNQESESNEVFSFRAMIIQRALDFARRGDDVPGCDRAGVQAGGQPLGQSTDCCFKSASLPRGLGSGACFAHF